MKKLTIIIISFLALCVVLFFRQPAVTETPPEPEGRLSIQSAEEISYSRVVVVSADPMSDTAEDQPFYTETQDVLIVSEPKKSDSSAVSTGNQSKNDEKPKSNYTVIHHEAEYTIIHHDAVTVHHEAEYKIIHHEAEGHYEETVLSPAWDEVVEKTSYEQHIVCNEGSCNMDFTAAGYTSSQIWDHLEAHAIKGEASGHHTEDKATNITETIHHDAIIDQVWVVDKTSWDEKVLVKDAWDEIIPAYDERVLVKEAWDEKIPG